MDVTLKQLLKLSEDAPLTSHKFFPFLGLKTQKYLQILPTY